MNLREHRIKSNLQTLDAISYNGLAYFLLANLATGAVNLALPTIEMSAGPSVATLAAYVLLTNGAAWLLHAKRLQLKVW